MYLHRLQVFFPLTWLLGSPSKLHICGTILLSVRVCAPELERKGKSENKGKMPRPHLPFSTPRISPSEWLQSTPEPTAEPMLCALPWPGLEDYTRPAPCHCACLRASLCGADHTSCSAKLSEDNQTLQGHLGAGVLPDIL